MIIDGHAHAAGIFFKIETLVPELDRLGVDKIVLAPMGVATGQQNSSINMGGNVGNGNHESWLQKIEDFCKNFSNIIYDKPNEYLYSLKQQLPDRIIQYYWANPNDPNIMPEIENHYAQWKFSGIKLQQMVSDFDTDQNSMHQIAEFCETHDMPLFIHLFKHKHVLQLIELMTDHQKTNFIVAHMIGYELIEENALGLDNFWFDISPYFLVPEKLIMKAINNYGAGRVMLGSDTPLGGNNSLEKNLERVNSLHIGNSDKEKILGLNLQALLKL